MIIINGIASKQNERTGIVCLIKLAIGKATFQCGDYKWVVIVFKSKLKTNLKEIKTFNHIINIKYIFKHRSILSRGLQKGNRTKLYNR